MTKSELQKELNNKLIKAGFSNVKQLVRNYSTSKASLEKAIERVNKMLNKGENENE